MIHQIEVRLDSRLTLDLIWQNHNLCTSFPRDVVRKCWIVKIVYKNKRNLLSFDRICNLPYMLRSRRNARAFFDRARQRHAKHSREVSPHFVELISLHATQRFRLFQPTACLSRQRLSAELIGFKEACEFPTPGEARQLLNSDQFQEFVAEQRGIDSFVKIRQA